MVRMLFVNSADMTDCPLSHQELQEDADVPGFRNLVTEMIGDIREQHKKS